MTEVLAVTGLVALPMLVAVMSFLPLGVERLRRLAVAFAAGAVLVSFVVAALPGLRDPVVALAAPATLMGGGRLVRVDELSAALLPLAAGLWLLAVAVTPAAALNRRGLRRTAIATAMTRLAFLSESPAVLLRLWTASVVVFLAALSGAAHRHQRRIAAVYLGASCALLAVGVLLISTSPPEALGETAGIWFVVAAALVRKGIFPFHAWVPEVFDHGRLGPAVLFSAPQLGAYVTVVLIDPRASPDLLRLVAMLALGTAVYGAVLALVQASARRACGYLFVSQSALVMAGLDCTSESALAGGLTLWLSAGMAVAGLARCVLVLEARRGRLDLSRFHGGYEQMPVLAICFLSMGLACTGFPGTLGFVGQELLVSGAVEVFPVMGFAVVVAAALTGLAVLRMYFSLFCGRPERADGPDHHMRLKRREAWTFASIVVLLVGCGIMPRVVIEPMFAASGEILKRRLERVTDAGVGRRTLSGSALRCTSPGRWAWTEAVNAHPPSLPSTPACSGAWLETVPSSNQPEGHPQTRPGGSCLV
jgi:NADH-quinone oxidoreductase subunit M